MAESPHNADPSDWAPCEPGTLTGLSRRMHAHDAKRSHSLVATGVLGGAALVLALVFWPGPAVATVKKIGCRECLKLMPAFHAEEVGKADDLPKEEVQAVEQHLNRCPPCRKHFQKKYPDCKLKCLPKESPQPEEAGEPGKQDSGKHDAEQGGLSSVVWGAPIRA